MHKPLPGRLINAALPGPVAMRSALIGVVTCVGSVRLPLWVQGVLLVGKKESGVPGDGAGLEALGAAFGTVSWCWAGWFFTTWCKNPGMFYKSSGNDNSAGFGGSLPPEMGLEKK